ncbi:MAG: tRNA preQ1(34) S-adenosylmethionine ribosyltransferase-isomerase QueA [Chitinivibrionales bacterium]|nr:tRNA preQ1(34) S-adenosylmethionine ribosyltransferase-isomerase QueA [Chitinivibrionales bacterium]
MKTSDFTYELPTELIAQQPAARRDESRLLWLRRDTGEVSHHRFSELPSLLHAGDRLVLNDTRVIPARLHCTRETGGAVEVLFTKRLTPMRWEALVRPGRRLRPGTVLFPAAEPQCRLQVHAVLPDGSRVIEMPDNELGDTLDSLIERVGAPPLPPYIEREADPRDRERYQTVYAREPGAIAAPTAGLHFTEELMQTLAEKGIERSCLTLHVGIGTFRPVKTEDPREHDIHTEQFVLPEQTGLEIAQTRQTGGRIVAVGTTSVRVLEYCATADGTVCPGSGDCNLFILPGYGFRAVDAMITNFHLPRSTLLMLVCAFAGMDPVLAAYREAVRQRYRFYSYGDAMLIA